jgi:hypothetical protein
LRRHREQVVGDVLAGLLVQVVTDARPVCQQCSMVTSPPMSGRSVPSTERAVVDMASALSFIKLTTVSAVSPFVPLAIANRVSKVFGIWKARWARPYALPNSISPPRSTDTTPANPL